MLMKQQHLDRRRFLARSTAAALGTAAGLNVRAQFTGDPAGSLTELPSLKGRKILYTWGGWNGHEPEQSVSLFKPWLESEGATVDVFNSLDPYADESYMAGIDLVIQIFTMAQISGEQEKGLLQAVRNGMGLAGWHGGCVWRGTCLGTVSDLPWAFGLPGSDVTRHPVELYAAVGLALVAVALTRMPLRPWMATGIAIAAAAAFRLATQPMRPSLPVVSRPSGASSSSPGSILFKTVLPIRSPERKAKAV